MDIVARFKKLYSGVIYDAMTFDLKYSKPFVVHRNIKPLWDINEHVVFGPAMTCKGQKVVREKDIDDEVRLKMFSEFTEGCVQVIDTGGDDSVAHFGDISGKIARKHGCIGAVVDGYTRDIKYIREDKFPIFGRGIQPEDAYGKWQIVDYQVDIFLQGNDDKVSVSAGDYIFADSDCVMVVEKEIAEDLCELSEKRLISENEIRQKIHSYDDIIQLNKDIGRW